MADGFDLRDEPWIPVKWESGESARCGLRELFHRAHEAVDLELPVPPAAAGLMRVLAVMSARIARGSKGMRLDDEDLVEEISDWLDARNGVLAGGRFDPAAVDTYFDDEVPPGRFDLFDPIRPFLQDPRLAGECRDSKGQPVSSGVNKLVIGRPTGVNGAVLFGHFTDTDPVAVPAAEAAWYLLAQLYNGPGGKCTPRQITREKTGTVEASPMRGLVSYFPWGPNLFASLVLAVAVPGSGAEADPQDVAPWEAAELPDPLGPLPSLTWPTGLLTGRFRHAVLLAPSEDRTKVVDAYITWATHAPAQRARDPYVILDRRRDGEYAPRDADGHRALWRDLDALLLQDSDPRSQRPLILNSLPVSWRSRLAVRAYGFDQERSQVVDRTWFEATTPPLLQWQEEADPVMARHVARCHQAAEAAGDRLEYAAKLAWKLATDVNAAGEKRPKIDAKKPGPWAGAAMRHFWPRAEAEFWRLAKPELCDTPALPAMVDTALAALDEAIGRVNRADIRVARARSRARAVVRGLLRSTADAA
ncbi:type I-E CRISPR-associated protein Cse1/CasA [Streptomyces cavernae]|uniref:type I-E CRISPR-associated protein Cse1/CasA n=1 Tax=Streptomyces cavernae TaxID=2259034 RepID=UPI000FEB63C8|nr:type I-E CRISPR-associated protein Cse1/CasA [Streptomyces cavernae]